LHRGGNELYGREYIVTASPAADVEQRVILALARYREPGHYRSIFEIAITLVPYVALWALAWAAVYFGHWELSILLGVPAAGFLVRLFMIQHDCGHGSFFRNRPANDWVGRFIGVLTLTPYDDWRRAHAVHHANTGHLERRGIGDINTLTVREFRALSAWGRIRYRLYRHPFVMFGLGSVYQFVLRHRFPLGSTRGWSNWTSSMVTNSAIALICTVLIWLIGIGPFLLVHIPIALFAGAIGIWLFYVQHQFEDAYWQSGDDWTYADAALRGSSYLKLPKVLQFFTGSIGLHHVHHLNARIPNYNLQRAHDSSPMFASVPTLSLRDGLRSVRLKLWDEQAGRLVTFAQARRGLIPAEALGG
jgi:omega-6 fatty acid desaturase (delta-12 desaturase)